MKNVKILDCTLRDGGRLINCNFHDSVISAISQGLCDANIDIIEIGFLRGNKDYESNSTFFTELEQINKFIPKNKKNSEFVVFSDYGKQYGMWDFNRIKPKSECLIDGFRIGYRKESLQEAIKVFEIVKDNGYKLFIQGVESLNYTDLEMLRAIETINKIKPVSFGIVDTYGAMYKEDVLRFLSLLDHNLDPEIAIDFHSHNNMQLSFSFAQEIIENCRSSREIIIDATLCGMGKGAGNLNTELMVEYLNKKKNYNYNQDLVLDLIDEYIQVVAENNKWGYSVHNFMAGIFSSHANNIDYLLGKHSLRTKDMRNIISRIEPEARKRYNYDNIEKIYSEYFSLKIDDSLAISKLSEILNNKKVLIIAPGSSITTYRDKIDTYIKNNDCIVISVNHIEEDADLIFFGNQRKYDKFANQIKNKNIIVTSNIETKNEAIIY